MYRSCSGGEGAQGQAPADSTADRSLLSAVCAHGGKGGKGASSWGTNPIHKGGALVT
jgi:hypothetical protein